MTVALNADEMTKHAFLNARQVRAAEALRKDRLTLELWTSQTATRPRMLGELLSLADQAGFQIPEEYALEDSGTEEPSLQRYSWKRATQGKDRVVDVLSGARIADLEFGDEGQVRSPLLDSKNSVGKSRLVDAELIAYVWRSLTRVRV